MKFGNLTARLATRRFWLWLITCLVLAVVVCFAGMRVYWRVQLKREIARIKAEGYPTTFEELNEFYPAVPDEDNMALILTNAFAQMDFELTDEEEELVPYLGTADNPTSIAPLDNRTAEAIDGVLSRNVVAFELIRRATQKRTYRFADISTPDLGNPKSEPWFGFKALSHLLRLKTYRHLSKDEPERGVESILLSLRLSNALESHPTLLAGIVRVAYVGLAIDQLQFAMQNVQPSGANLEKLREEIDWILGQSSPARSFAGDFPHVLFFGYYNRDKLDDALGIPSVNEWASIFDLEYVVRYYEYRLSGRVDADLRFYLARLAEAVETSRDDQLMFDFVRSEQEGKFDALLPTSGSYPMSKWIVVFSKGMVRFLTSKRFLAASDAALAVEQYRRKNGNLPESLDVLVPSVLNAVPTDYESGQPMRILGTPHGFGVGTTTPLFQVRTNFTEPSHSPVPSVTSAP